jgi:hypothetical protein
MDHRVPKEQLGHHLRGQLELKGQVEDKVLQVLQDHKVLKDL